ncbi:hypothetical protein [Streptomyces sp. IMTB 2501]|uniref:hypothetical protein n=1 Tax=Streptomyces sp. IMTB 2501 TaxID=1776340 RepID=UPI00117CE17F|nr:hypothetical protein [Streptomyces sp. IMTB 2501]
MREPLTARAREENRGLVGLSFENGYADFVTGAPPRPRRRRCAATVFVAFGRLGGEIDRESRGPHKQPPGADGIRRLVAADVEAAAHNAGHRHACAIAPCPGITGDPALPHIDAGRSDASAHLETKRRPARAWGRVWEKTA